MNETDVRPEKHMVLNIPKEPAVVAALLTVLLMNLVFHLSRRATSILLVGMRCMLLAHDASQDSAKIPSDPRAVLKGFSLDPHCSSFLQCPDCYALYPYSGTVTSISPEFKNCTHRPTPSSPPCDAALWEQRRLGGKIVHAPRRKYIHQNLKEWVGRLLTRPGVEEVLREPCNKPETSTMEDIWDAPVLRNFKDVDEKSFFRDRQGELRLAFSLNVDGFHPLHMLESKQTLSCTAIYMVVLNFPPTLRYLFRNMYLAGVIPGPGKPSLDQINHVLSLLVQELLDFWRGVFYTITFASASGLLTKGVMIPLVCDMLAARQICGLGSATSTWFCTCCFLTIQEIENLDRSSWPPRDLKEQVKQARLWKTSKSEDDRNAIFKAYGVRWSVLLDLPYWNPILFSVVDSMHSAYLGLFQTHCRRIWRINISVEGGDGTLIIPSKTDPRPKDSVMSYWLDIIRNADTDLLYDELKDCTKSILWHVCRDNNIRSAGTRSQLISNIIKWVSFTGTYVHNQSVTLCQRSRVTSESIELSDCPADRGDYDIDDTDDTDDTGDGKDPPSEPENTAEVDKQFKRHVEETDAAFVLHRIGERGLARLRNSTLQAMCNLRELDEGGKKEDLVTRLMDWVRVVLNCAHARLTPFQRELNLPDPPEQVSESRDVLGRDILEAVWHDMACTELPSWMSPAPRNWGTAKRGKLTADQWKVVATVHLPITLMRLWGAPQDGRRFLILCNFMDLSAAVQLAHQRIITEKHIDDYERLLQRYLSGMMVLFKDSKLQPIHHVSQHAGEFLRLFGPTHSVRTQGFERFNEKLGLQNTNGKSGAFSHASIRFCLSFSRGARGYIHDDSMQDGQLGMDDAG